MEDKGGMNEENVSKWELEDIASQIRSIIGINEQWGNKDSYAYKSIKEEARIGLKKIQKTIKKIKQNE